MSALDTKCPCASCAYQRALAADVLLHVGMGVGVAERHWTVALTFYAEGETINRWMTWPAWVAMTCGCDGCGEIRKRGERS